MNCSQGVGAATAWAFDEVRDAQLGDVRLAKRLGLMLGAAASRPTGVVTGVFRGAADREGAYRFLENDAVAAQEIVAAASRACARRCDGLPFIFVPVDGSSLSLPDCHGARGLGNIGPAIRGGTGVKVMSGIGVEPSGTPVGVFGQFWWNRSKVLRRKDHAKRALEDKETANWFKVIEQTRTALATEGIESRPWFQMDREADFHNMLSWAVDSNTWITVRASTNRRVNDAQVDRLWNALESRKPSARYDIDVPEGRKRSARKAKMVLRFGNVELVLRDKRSGRTRVVLLGAVHTRETGSVPAGERPLEWMLLTTHALDTVEDALLTVRGYTQRWRIEDFHKTWKSVCQVEKTQLRTVAAIARWATILSIVAGRIERLKHLARTEPDSPASVEFSRTEVDVIIALREPKGVRAGDMPTIEQVVRWVADLGGYTGKSSGGPPGNITIGRGLEFIQSAVVLAEKIRALEK